VRAAGENFRRQAADLGNTAEGAVREVEDVYGKLKSQTGELFATGDRVAAKAEELGGVFERQVGELIRTSDAAAQQAASLKQMRAEVGLESFLQGAAFVVERLQSIAVDVARLFQPDIDDETWRRFQKGDQAVFVRRLLKTLDRSKIDQARRKVAEDGQFRHYVVRYVNEFENLLSRAKTSDRADVLTATFTSAEVGKLYLLLARVLGRIE
jgi:hypothetical protein